jgi:hypothetical protein
MRALFALLVIANLALAGYALLGPRRVSPDTDLPSRQLNADQITIVPPRPAVVVPRKVVCMEWTGVSDADLASARIAIDALQLGERITVIDVAPSPGWWVFIPPLNSRIEVSKKIAELEGLGVREHYIVESGPMRNAVSLGMFSTEDGATTFLEAQRERGVRSARVGQREHRHVFRVREPDAPTAARLGEIKGGFPGTELKSLDCPAAPSASR